MIGPQTRSEWRIAEFNDAFESRNFNAIKTLLTKSSTIRNYVRSEGEHLLRTVASKGELAILELLLQFPEVEAKAASGHLGFENLALYNAVRDGHYPIVERLLKIPHVLERAVIQDRHGNNAILREAVKNGDLRIVNRLLEIDSVMALVTVNNQKPAVFRRLFDLDAETAQIHENAILLQGACSGNLMVVKRLLEIPAVKSVLMQQPSEFHVKLLKHILHAIARKNATVIAEIDVDILQTLIQIARDREMDLSSHLTDMEKDIYETHAPARLSLQALCVRLMPLAELNLLPSYIRSTINSNILMRSDAWTSPVVASSSEEGSDPDNIPPPRLR